METKGKFIVIEGGEGSGKSTQLSKLKEWLPTQYPGREIVFTREPGGSPLAEEIREVMVSDRAKSAGGSAMFGLVMAARSDHAEQLILPSLATGKIVISDRYLASTYAYQLIAQGSTGLEQAFWAYATLFPIPDLYILLEVSPAIGSARTESRKSRSHFDARPAEFHAKVREGYRGYFAKAGITPAVIDADKDIEEVWQAVQKAVQSVL